MLRDSKNNLLHDGRTTNIYNLGGAIALVIAPGAILRRTQSATTFHHQVRNCTVGVDCNSAGRCTASPPTNTPTCWPRNYLDRRVGWQDNENFVEGGSNPNGFIQGDILDASQNIIVNDKILSIGYDDLLPLLEQRVARELLICLEEYAEHNNQRYPWAARVDDGTGTGAPNYVDFLDTRFGRVPDPPFNATATAITGMSNSWFANCNIRDISAATNWWLNWKEQVFYAVADAYKPGPTVPLPSCPICLTVDPPSINPDRRIAVMVAGTYLAASSPSIPANQVRANPPALDKVEINNYLEGENANLDDIFTSGLPSSGFNDVTCDRGICP